MTKYGLKTEDTRHLPGMGVVGPGIDGFFNQLNIDVDTEGFGADYNFIDDFHETGVKLYMGECEPYIELTDPYRRAERVIVMELGDNFKTPMCFLQGPIIKGVDYTIGGRGFSLQAKTLLEAVIKNGDAQMAYVELYGDAKDADDLYFCVLRDIDWLNKTNTPFRHIKNLREIQITAPDDENHLIKAVGYVYAKKK